MLLSPLSWYEKFPAEIPHTGPLNAHFVRDLGVVYLVVALAFAWAARNVERSRFVHFALTVFFVGHAVIHFAEIAAGRLPHAHWLIDMPGSIHAGAINDDPGCPCLEEEVNVIRRFH
jgi:hypothetical protein